MSAQCSAKHHSPPPVEECRETFRKERHGSGTAESSGTVSEQCRRQTHCPEPSDGRHLLDARQRSRRHRRRPAAQSGECLNVPREQADFRQHQHESAPSNSQTRSNCVERLSFPTYLNSVSFPTECNQHHRAGHLVRVREAERSADVLERPLPRAELLRPEQVRRHDGAVAVHPAGSGRRGSTSKRQQRERRGRRRRPTPASVTSRYKLTSRASLNVRC